MLTITDHKMFLTFAGLYIVHGDPVTRSPESPRANIMSLTIPYDRLMERFNLTKQEWSDGFVTRMISSLRANGAIPILSNSLLSKRSKRNGKDSLTITFAGESILDKLDSIGISLPVTIPPDARANEYDGQLTTNLKRSEQMVTLSFDTGKLNGFTAGDLSLVSAIISLRGRWNGGLGMTLEFADRATAIEIRDMIWSAMGTATDADDFTEEENPGYETHRSTGRGMRFAASPQILLAWMRKGLFKDMLNNTLALECLEGLSKKSYIKTRELDREVIREFGETIGLEGKHILLRSYQPGDDELPLTSLAKPLASDPDLIPLTDVTSAMLEGVEIQGRVFGQRLKERRASVLGRIERPDKPMDHTSISTGTQELPQKVFAEAGASGSTMYYDFENEEISGKADDCSKNCSGSESIISLPDSNPVPVPDLAIGSQKYPDVSEVQENPSGAVPMDPEAYVPRTRAKRSDSRAGKKAHAILGQLDEDGTKKFVPGDDELLPPEFYDRWFTRFQDEGALDEDANLLNRALYDILKEEREKEAMAILAPHGWKSYYDYSMRHEKYLNIMAPGTGKPGL